jgi:hypothetical protein
MEKALAINTASIISKVNNKRGLSLVATPSCLYGYNLFGKEIEIHFI